MTWPPAKPISMRTERSWSARGDHLREHSVDRVRVDERNLEAEQSLARMLVDQIGARVGEARDRLLDVRDLVGDVVHPGAALGEKATDGRVLGERLQQLHATSSD